MDRLSAHQAGSVSGVSTTVGSLRRTALSATGDDGDEIPIGDQA